VTDIKKETGLDSWYDEKNKVIYMGSEGDRRVTAGAYNLIEQLRELNNSGGTRKEKEVAMEEIMTKLKRKWSYTGAYLEWKGNTAKLYKSKDLQVFHTGVQQGIVGGNQSGNRHQRELLAMLQAGEIVLNRQDQNVLLANLQTLETMATTLKKLQLDTMPVGNVGATEVNVTVQAPITITGSADADTLKELEKFKKNISKDVLGEVTDAMKKRGYSSNTAANARKK